MTRSPLLKPLKFVHSVFGGHPAWGAVASVTVADCRGKNEGDDIHSTARIASRPSRIVASAMPSVILSAFLLCRRVISTIPLNHREGCDVLRRGWHMSLPKSGAGRALLWDSSPVSRNPPPGHPVGTRC